MTNPSFEISEPTTSTARHSTGSTGAEIEAIHRLGRSGYSAFNDLSCEVVGADLWLRGRLPTYYLKQMAQAIVAQVEGVRRVINHIEVAPNSGRSIPSGGGEPLRLVNQP
ncbi:MAG: hypothetical protein ABS79_05555 [Planctomycetes bacterium SCN 63-9]|nr:MAG: hypothetical protein ABS79_05555 [Planctomycetes bacterium SCN 63-9]